MTKLNSEQATALVAIGGFLSGDDNFFVLSGSAGTGKTFCIRELTNLTKGRFIFTAPTNKATKVLRESVTQDDYKPECRTIYSLLGLRLEASGEIKELKAPEDPIDLSQYRAVIVDEGSMVNAQLFEHIQGAADKFKIKFLFLGDPAQLPPVGEAASPIWAISVGSKLTKVMRHDNQILELATRLRAQVDRVAPTIKLAASNDGEQGIWKLEGMAFMQRILATAPDFAQPNQSKVIAWRNVEVDKFNKAIRNAIFDYPTLPWLVGDRVLFAGPARDLDDEPMASTDDEGEVTRVDEEWHAVHGSFKIYRIAITLDDNRPVIARVLHPDSFADYQRKLDDLSAIARSNSRKWRDFWDFKDAFHQLKYAYAITAHRAQGSTYDTAFVYWQDILLNRNRQEAYRCLYVACTRPSRCLILS
jgi:exodeoxyribonuclease-5